MNASVIAGIGEVLWDVFPDAAHFGGAPANFACHAASLGAEAWMVSAVGADELGDRALSALRLRNVECAKVAYDPRHATGRVLVTLNDIGQASYEFAADTAWDHLEWSDELGPLAARCDAKCFGTLGQRSPISRETIRRFVEATPQTALRIFDVNLRQRFYDAETIRASLQIATALKLNDEELPIVGELCGLHAVTPREMLIELATNYDLRLTALTRGPRGSLLLAGSEEDECSAPPTTVVDTVGAGDAFTATLVSGFLRSLPLAAINRHANAVAAYVCSQNGATPPLPKKLSSPPYALAESSVAAWRIEAPRHGEAPRKDGAAPRTIVRRIGRDHALAAAPWENRSKSPGRRWIAGAAALTTRLSATPSARISSTGRRTLS